MNPSGSNGHAGGARFSKMFKMPSKSSTNLVLSDDRPPPPPEKDAVYLATLHASRPYKQNMASQSTTSFTPTTPNSTSTFKKAWYKLPGLPPLRKSSNSSSIKSSKSQTSMDDGGYGAISIPFNVQHDLHVESNEEGLAGLPIQWSAALASAGFTATEIQAMYASQRRKAKNPPVPLPIGVPPLPQQNRAMSPQQMQALSYSPSPPISPWQSQSSKPSFDTYPPPPSIPRAPRVPSPTPTSTSVHTTKSSPAQTPQRPATPQQSVPAPVPIPPPDSPTAPIPPAPRAFRIANPDPKPAPQSPPPPEPSLSRKASNLSRKSSKKAGPSSFFTSRPGSSDADTSRTSVLSSSTETDSISFSPPQIRTPSLPPRLSLHQEQQDGDDWSKSLLSIVAENTTIAEEPPSVTTPKKPSSSANSSPIGGFLTPLTDRSPNVQSSPLSSPQPSTSASSTFTIPSFPTPPASRSLSRPHIDSAALSLKDLPAARAAIGETRFSTLSTTSSDDYTPPTAPSKKFEAERLPPIPPSPKYPPTSEPPPQVSIRLASPPPSLKPSPPIELNFDLDDAYDPQSVPHTSNPSTPMQSTMSEDDGQHSRWSVTPRSSINSSTDYAEDSVLEGWLNGEAEEEIMTPMNAFPTTPTITLNGASYTSIANSLLPYVFDPLIPYLYQGNPRLRYTDLTQVAEGQYGPVYSALIPDNEDETHQPSVVAVKLIPVDRKEGSPKIKMIAGELELLHGVTHQNVLATTRLYVDVEDAEADEDDGGPTLWVEMELMERSLADVLPLVEDGLEIPEGVVARLASDVLVGLSFLEGLGIAHRDVRSDNLLLSRDGYLKIADFSHAVQSSSGPNSRNSVMSVPPYWMAPEMRNGIPYDPHKADVWSVGATIWEVIEGAPPFVQLEDPRQFSDRWPDLTNADDYTLALHHFLRLCSEPEKTRPSASDLLAGAFIKSASPRTSVTRMLLRARTMEDELQRAG